LTSRRVSEKRVLRARLDGPLQQRAELDDTGAAAVTAASRSATLAVVVYSYPKGDTPGCTKEACGFRADAGKHPEQVWEAVRGGGASR